LFVVLAFFGSSLRNQFWPFTDVLQEIRREVTQKKLEFFKQKERKTAKNPFGSTETTVIVFFVAFC
jgi:hypothetical protein